MEISFIIERYDIMWVVGGPSCFFVMTPRFQQNTMDTICCRVEYNVYILSVGPRGWFYTDYRALLRDDFEGKGTGDIGPSRTPHIVLFKYIGAPRGRMTDTALPQVL